MSNQEKETELQRNCNFCTSQVINILGKALCEKYSSSQNFYYSKQINELVGDQLTRAAVALLEWQVLDDEDEFLKRQYKIQQYEKKSKALGDYYQYHRQLPRFFGLPIEITIKKYHDKVRDHEYKVVKRMMNETQQSLFDPSMVPSRSLNSHSSMSNLLQKLNINEIRVEESVAFLQVVKQLKQLTKNDPNNIDFKGDFFLTTNNTNNRNFELYLQRIAKRKKKAQMSMVSIEKKASSTRGETHIEFGSKQIKQQQQELVLKNLTSQNYKFRSKMSERVDTLLHALQKTKPIMKKLIGTQIIPKFNKAQRERSIEKIYGKGFTDRQGSSHKFQSIKFMTLQNDKHKEKYDVYGTNYKGEKKSIQPITIDFCTKTKSQSKKQFRISLKGQDINKQQRNSQLNTARKKQYTLSRAVLKRKSQSVPNIKSLKNIKSIQKSKQTLDPLKAFKNIKGII